MKSVLVLFVCLAAVSGTMLSKKMMKKYAFGKAMMGCFGSEVMQRYHKQYREAMEKCRGHAETVEEKLIEVDEVDTIVEEMAEQQQSNYRRRRSFHDIDADKMQKMRHELDHRVANFSCVMKHMGLTDETGAVTAALVKEHITSMQLESEHLTKDLMTGADRCGEYAACIPDSLFESSPLGAVSTRNIKMMKCFKGAKMEACMRQDFRHMHRETLTAAQLAEDEAFNLIAASSLVKEMTDM